MHLPGIWDWEPTAVADAEGSSACAVETMGHGFLHFVHQHNTHSDNAATKKPKKPTTTKKQKTKQNKTVLGFQIIDANLFLQLHFP